MIARYFVALLILLVTALAQATPPHRVGWTRAALERLPVANADRTPERRELRAQQLDIFAVEITRVSAKAPLPPRQWSSLLGSVAFGESALDTDIVAGRCKAFQCDPKRVDGVIRFQSVGAFQQKLFAHVADMWPAAAKGSIPAQVEMADRQLRRSLTRCKPFAPHPQHIYRAYGGGSCSFPVHREDVKVGAYHRMMATPTPKQGGKS
jgi:hypothetical protein